MIHDIGQDNFRSERLTYTRQMATCHPLYELLYLSSEDSSGLLSNSPSLFSFSYSMVIIFNAFNFVMSHPGRKVLTADFS